MNIAAWSDWNLREFGVYDSLLCDGRRWTNAELHDRGCRFGTVLAEAGIQPGDRVLIALPNGADLAVAALGVWRCGAVLVLGS